LTRKAGRRTGRAAARGPTGYRGGSSGGTQRKRAAAEAAAVTENERQRRRRPLHKAGAAKRAAVAESGRPLQAAVTGSGRYRRPLQKAGGGDIICRSRKRAAVTSGWYRKLPIQFRRTLQETGGGRDGGRYINNAQRQDTPALFG
jgi:hypothetical protein